MAAGRVGSQSWRGPSTASVQIALDFTYARSYLDNESAISLYSPELPLRRGAQEPLDGLTVAACLKDATPDSWGERVIGNRLASGDQELSIETYMLESGSNRLGAIDFQESSEDYRPRLDTASLDELYDAAEKVLGGEPLNPAIGDALMNGTAIGGAHPKVLIRDESGVDCIAKLSVSTDVHPWIRAEAVAIELARRCGIDVPNARVIKSMGRDVLLIERFDRLPGSQAPARRLRSDDAGLRCAPRRALRLVPRDARRACVSWGRPRRTSVASSSSESSSMSRSATTTTTPATMQRSGTVQSLDLTPAFDLTPQLRSTDTSAQAMAIGRDGSRASQFSVCVAAAADYGLSRPEARQIIDRIVSTIEDDWPPLPTPPG